VRGRRARRPAAQWLRDLGTAAGGAAAAGGGDAWWRGFPSLLFFFSFLLFVSVVSISLSSSILKLVESES
jgi:hypothetical protein